MVNEFFWDGVVEVQEEFGLGDEFVYPFFRVDCHDVVEALFIEVFEAVGVDVIEFGDPADACFGGVSCAFAAFDDPFEDAHVFGESGPEEVSFVVEAEPVDVEEAWEGFDLFSHIDPVAEVVAHVVSAEGEHSHWVAADLSGCAGGRGGGLGAHGGADVNAVLPVEGLVDERHGGLPAAAEDDGINGDAVRILPVGINGWTL